MPHESPFTLNLTRGVALMMVGWENTLMEISIPNYPGTNITTRYVTPNNLVSFFAFKYNSTITFYFQNNITFFTVTAPMEMNEPEFISNSKLGDLSLHMVNDPHSVFLYSPDTYRFVIEVGRENVYQVFYYEDWLKNMSKGKSYYTRLITGKTFESLYFYSGHAEVDFIGSYQEIASLRIKTYNDHNMVPTTKADVLAKIYSSDFTYQERIFGGNYKNPRELKFTSLSENPTYFININISQRLQDIAKIYYVENKDKLDEIIISNTTKSIQLKSSTPPKLLITYGSCKKYHLQNLTINDIFNSFEYDIFDIPSQCNPLISNITFAPELSSVPFLYNFDNYKNISIYGNVSFIFIKNSYYSLNFYVLYKHCFEYVKVNEYDIDNPNSVTQIRITKDDIPETCFIEKQYAIQFVNKFASPEYFLVINGTTIGQNSSIIINDTKPHQVQVYFTSNGSCDSEFLETIDVSTPNVTVKVYDDNSYLDYYCKLYMMFIDIYLPEIYQLGYSIEEDKDDKIIPFEDRQLYISRTTYFRIHIYVMNVSDLDCTNYKIKEFASNKRPIFNNISLKDLPEKCLIHPSFTPTESPSESISMTPNPTETPIPESTPTQSPTLSPSSSPKRTQIYDDDFDPIIENINSNSSVFEMTSKGFDTEENGATDISQSNNKLNLITFQNKEIVIKEKSSFNSESPLYFAASSENSKIIIDKNVESSNIGIMSQNSPNIELSKSDAPISLKNDLLDGQFILSISSNEKIEKISLNDINNRGNVHFSIPQGVNIISCKHAHFSGISSFEFSYNDNNKAILLYATMLIETVQLEIRESMNVNSKSETTLKNVNLRGNMIIYSDSTLMIDNFNPSPVDSTIEIIFQKPMNHRSTPIIKIEKIQALPSSIKVKSNINDPLSLKDFKVIQTSDASTCQEIAQKVQTNEINKEKITARCNGDNIIYLNSEKEDNKKSLSGGAIAGIVIGCIAAIAIIVVVVIIILKKRRTTNTSEVEDIENNNEV